MTGRPLAYVIASMWDGGNISRYTPERPRVLIDGRPGRARGSTSASRAKGAVVAWTGDPRALPLEYRVFAEEAKIQPPLTPPMRLGPGSVTVAWAVCARPVVAGACPGCSVAP